MALGGAYVAVAEGWKACGKIPPARPIVALAKPAAGATTPRSARFSWTATTSTTTAIPPTSTAATPWSTWAACSAYRGSASVFTVAQEYDLDTANGLRQFQLQRGGHRFRLAVTEPGIFLWVEDPPFGLEARPEGGGSRFLRLSGSAATAGVLGTPAGNWRVGLSYAGSVRMTDASRRRHKHRRR